MKGFDNNEMSVRTLENLKNSLDNRIHEIYNQGYREGYKDGVNDAMQKIADSILSEVEDDKQQAKGRQIRKTYSKGATRSRL